MLGMKPKAYKRSVAVSLDDLVPSDNFYRVLDAKLGLSFVRTLVQEQYARAAFD